MIINVTKKDGIYLSIIGLIIVGAILFTYVQSTNCNNGYQGFTGEDKNYLMNLAIEEVNASTNCAYFGLKDDLLIQDRNGVPYGIPICVEKGE